MCTLKIRMGRYRDKPDVDWSRYAKKSGTGEDSDGLSPSRAANSTEGRWHYHAWVEEGTAEEEECYHLIPANSGGRIHARNGVSS